MMIQSLRVFLLCAVAVYAAVIVFMLKTAKFSVRFSLLWIISGVLMLAAAIFPEAVIWASNLIGISNPVNAVFFFFACFSIVMLVSLTAIVTELSAKNLRLIQSVGLLEERVRRLEKEEKE